MEILSDLQPVGPNHGSCRCHRTSERTSWPHCNASAESRENIGETCSHRSLQEFELAALSGRTGCPSTKPTRTYLSIPKVYFTLEPQLRCRATLPRGSKTWIQFS